VRPEHLREAVPRSLKGLSVGAKLALATVTIIALVAAVVTLEITTRERDTLIGGKRAAAAVASDLLAATLIAPLDFADEDAIDADLKNLSANRDVLWAAVFPATGHPRVVMLRPDATALIPGAPPHEAPGMVWTESRLEVARPIVRADGRRLGTLLVAFDLSPEIATFAATRRRILWMSLAVAAATVGLLVVASRRYLVRPLLRLTDAASRIEHGERGVRVALQSGDELGQLGRVFDNMSDAIVQRENELAEATRNLRELFDHMRQAIVVFGPDGTIEQAASQQAKELFGEVTGRAIRDVLYGSSTGVEVQAFDEWMKLAFELPSDAWSDMASLAPATVRVGERLLALDFEPIDKDGRTAKVMLLAIDVTDVRRLEETVRVQEEEHARRIRAMRRLVAGGGQVFVAFLSGARERLERCRGLLEDALTDATIEEILRHAHTVKGEASAFDLAPVVEAAHALEDELVKVRARSVPQDGPRSVRSEDRQRWCERVDSVMEALERARDLFVEASPIGPSILDQVTVERGDLEKLHAIAGARTDELGAVSARLAARPFGEACALLAEKVPTWAATLGKSARLEVEGRDGRVPRELAAVLPGVLAHLVRNAVVHGIEPETERGGKPGTGVVRASCITDGAGVRIVIEDDGRGVDVDALRLRGDSDDLDDLLFSRISITDTATELAGRGVGLPAVRSTLMPLGYTVSVMSEEGRGMRALIETRTRARASRAS